MRRLLQHWGRYFLPLTAVLALISTVHYSIHRDPVIFIMLAVPAAGSALTAYLESRTNNRKKF